MSRTKRMRRSAAEWSALVAECERSGLSRASFAEREGIHPGTFGFWASRLAPRRSKSPRAAKVSAPSEFVPVRVSTRGAQRTKAVSSSAITKSSASKRVEVVLGNGRRVRFDLSHAVDPRLAALLAVAEGGRGC
jgi:transposase-like protein